MALAVDRLLHVAGRARDARGERRRDPPSPFGVVGHDDHLLRGLSTIEPVRMLPDEVRDPGRLAMGATPPRPATPVRLLALARLPVPAVVEDEDQPARLDLL